MNRYTPCLRSRTDIIAIELLKNNDIIFATQSKVIKIFSFRDCKIKQNLSIDLLGYKTTAIAFHKTLDIVAIANSNVIYIVNTKTKEVTQTIPATDGSVMKLAFIDNSPYILSGTTHGRVFQYRYDKKSFLSRICSFPYIGNGKKVIAKTNYVSVITSYQNLIACSGYGGAIIISKLNSHSNRIVIEVSKVKITALTFLSKNIIVAANSTGHIFIIDIKIKSATKTIDTAFDEISEIVSIPNTKFLFLISKSKQIALLNSESKKLINSNFLHFANDAKAIKVIDEKNLIILLQNNEFIHVALASASKIKSYIMKNELDKAFELIKQNPMLEGTKEHKRIEVLYKKIFDKAVESLIHSRQQEAWQLLEPFKNIESKADEIRDLFESFDLYPKFRNLFLNKKYPLAYVFCDKRKALQYTRQYKKMEEIFHETYDFAQKQILMGREDVAHEMLSPYMVVSSKREIIKLLLRQNDSLLEFLQAIEEKNYFVINKLANEYPILCEIPSYMLLKQSNTASLETIRELIYETKLDEAVDMIKELESDLYLKDELVKLYDEVNIVRKFLNYYNKNNFVKCYEMIDKHELLENLEIANMLEMHWLKLTGECEKYAFEGDIKALKKTMGDLIGIKTRTAKIGDLLRLCFWIKIKQLITVKAFNNAQNIIYSYIDIFGFDKEIDAIMQRYEKASSNKLAIIPQDQKYKPRDNWLNSKKIMG